MPEPSERLTSRPLDRLVAQVRVILAFERVWPFCVATVAVVAAFVAISWLGAWVDLPVLAREAGLLVFALALGAVAWRLVRLRAPTRAEALRRLDRDSGLAHHPVSTADDVLADPDADPATRALWDLHRRRQLAAVSRTRIRPPSPRLADRDPYAIRAAVLLVLVGSAFVAGPERLGRLAAAFAWSTPDTAPGTRIDAWIDPPAYTGKPPLILLGASAPAAARAADGLSVPAGSVVIVRASGGAVEVTTDGGLKPEPAKSAAAPAPPPSAQTADRRFVLSGDGHLRIAGPAGAQFALRVIPDLPPRIALSGTPVPNLSGSLNLAYKIEDDYGVVGAEARFANPVVRGRPVTGRTLVEPPRGVLSLPPLPGGLGDGKTTLDLSDHPWAGATVSMTLAARDEGGNVGESAPVKITLPAKPFSNPLARALVEQRRNLVLAPDARDGVDIALDALQIAPDLFAVPPAIYLGIHTAQLRLAAAKTDADLLGVADFLWEMALRIENGDLSKTEQDLRAAQKALKEAIERGASSDEIKRLTDNLRQQMSKYLAEMLEQQKRDGDKAEATPDRNSRKITEQDLKSLMDRMEQAARNGDMAEAQRLLDQLNSIMENLKTAKRSSGQSQETREMNRSMNELDRMMRDQGDVRDKTFQRNQNPDAPDAPGSAPDGSDAQAGQEPQDGGAGNPSDQPGQQNGSQSGRKGSAKPGYDALKRRQQALAGQLDDLQRKLRGLGMKGEQGLSDAQDAMKDAENALGQGQGDNAVEAQGRALDGLKKGAGGLAQQMAEGGKDGEQAQGQGGEQDSDSMEQGEDLDPLGRPRQGRGATQGKDLDVSGGLAARAQQVLQELRRRLGDPSRSQQEKDYLERLLKRY